MRNVALTGLTVCAVLLLVAAATYGQTPEEDGSSAGTTITLAAGRVSPVVSDSPSRPSGSVALTASVVYPGLGQLLNDSEMKAAVIGAVEAFLIARLVLEDRWTRDSKRNYVETGSAVWYNEYSEHYDRRQTLVWWAAIAALYSLTDAYVDAHLAGFDDPLPAYLDAVSIGPGSGGDEFRVALSVRF